MRSTPDPAVLLATRSSDKAREIRAILLQSLPWRIVTLDDIGIKPDPAEEDIEIFASFLGNAHAKAAYFLRQTGLTTLADDSGLCVHTLGGEPGVNSRRYARQPGLEGAALDYANNERLVRDLEGTPAHERSAHYACAAVLHRPNGLRSSAVGTCAGLILEAPRGTRGFGYDPLFLDPDTGLSFAEMDPLEKNRSSHRARAFRALASIVPVHLP